LQGRPAVVHASVENRGLIDNLPAEGVVEVEVMVDRQGFHPCKFGPLPPQCAALSASNMRHFELAVRSILDKDADAALYSLLLDPLTAAVCSPAEVKKMFTELVRTEKDYLPKYLTKAFARS
jgi:alpha-galactosidase